MSSVSGFALPLCLLSLSGLLMLGLYCWREASFMHDIVHEQKIHKNVVEQATHALLQCIKTVIIPSFSKFLAATQATKKPQNFFFNNARVRIAALPHHPQTLRVVLSLMREQEVLVTVSCGLVQLQGDPNDQRFVVRYFTVGATG